ncbi:MAG: DegT/DnrJ/EryC1/StrS family aminotransferase [Clostridia bacterium]|nr:DegT/DnrJ/EryC1/StrS family aminotransferase [Oscillospiraceae bacterium]MBQ7960331.1 DegT/DnrJ/EryC1/StrS family aminotransferase [Clostridia bacterium]
MFRMGQEEIDAVARVIESKELFRVNNALKEAEKFDKEFSKVIGTEYSILVSSGTGALMTALASLGIGPGDEVIVPGYTFMASASAVLAVGAIPVLAEINETMTIDPQDIEKKISKYTKAIIPVHICGYPCDMDAVCEIAKKHNLYVIEDACQADGGSYKGRRVGSIGDAGAFSFNHWKLLSAGEGGSIVTNNRKVYERALIYHDGGAAFRPYSGDFTEPVFMGTQMRTNEITAAIMRVQLGRMDGIIEDLRRVKATLMERLAGCDLFDFAPSNDIKGDLGTTLPLQFKDKAVARRFADAINGKINGILVADSGKHIYYNWTPLMEHRGSHCDATNPYNLAENKDLNMEYSHDMLPRTIDLVERTYHVLPHCDWTEQDIDNTVNAIWEVCNSIK